MKVTKDYKGLKDVGWRYEYEGNIVSDESIDFSGLDKSIYVSGSIKSGDYIESGVSIKSGGYIESGGSIKSGGYIESGGSIKSGGSILAELHVKAKATIIVGIAIFAGCCTWKQNTDEDKLIECSKFTGKVEYGILKETGEIKRKITIDKKEIEISEESYQELKRSLS